MSDLQKNLTQVVTCVLYFCTVEYKGKKEGEEKEEDKPMFLKDYERKQLLERGAMAGVSDSEEEEDTKVREHRGGG